MPPKKKAAKKEHNGEAVAGEDPLQLLNNYQKFCRLIGVPINPKVVSQLQDQEHLPITQLVVDDEFGPLGPGGTRALTTSILGTGQDMKGGPYKLLKGLRLWRVNCADEGTRSISEILRLGGGDIKLEYLEMLDCRVGGTGALALGQALAAGCNRSLLSLKLDYNQTLGSEGARALCRGLRTNATLRQLHLPYCGVGGDAGAALGEMLSYSKLQLAVLNLQGNRLGGEGLRDLAPGLARNGSVTYLSLADNAIGGVARDVEALALFRDAILACTTLSHVDLLYNRIGPDGATTLLPALAPDNAQIRQFLVDATLPTPLFDALHRRDAGAKKKGGGKKVRRTRQRSSYKFRLKM
ncbi:leucine rich repeat protein [Tribonema minus]|uniref:Leucine rich repeat protein n=1 Tax=Tribonema minus TaxID=303371 RepID=A0A835YWH7_9STRA|nr:leucine rich repeat protein [Tribonema minus]